MHYTKFLSVTSLETTYTRVAKRYNSIWSVVGTEKKNIFISDKILKLWLLHIKTFLEKVGVTKVNFKIVRK